MSKVDESFLRAIVKDKAFALLDSATRVWAYRAAGATIGEGVEIGEGSVFVADDLEIGEHTIIGKRLDARTRSIRIGAWCYTGNDIMVGGGGAWQPQAHISIGNDCLISSDCQLNCGEGLTIGNHVGLSRGVEMYTHSFWQSVLDGYKAQHAPIVIENDVYLTGGVMITAGVTVGHGAVVLAHSVVVHDIEPRVIASGIPAVKISEVKPPTPEQRKAIIKRLVEQMNMPNVIFRECILYRDLFALNCIIVAMQTFGLDDDLHITPVFDMTRLHIYGKQTRESDEVRNWFRRRGILFSPPWRYTHDKDVVAQ